MKVGAKLCVFSSTLPYAHPVILLQFLLTDTVVWGNREKGSRHDTVQKKKSKLALNMKRSFQFGDDTEASQSKTWIK